MDPFTALGAASGVVGIVSFGLQLATTLQTHIESSLEASERLKAIAHDISATSSALQQLETIIEIDQKSKRKVFSSAGLKGVRDTAGQCEVVFKKVVGLLNDATKSKGEGGDGDGEVIEAWRLGRMERLKWPWLEPKISRCRQELERLLLKLLVMLQVVTLGRHQMMTSKQPAGEDLNAKQLREIIMALDRREKLATQKLAEMEVKEVKIVDQKDGFEDDPGIVLSASEAAERHPVEEIQMSKGIDSTESEFEVQSKPSFDSVISGPDSLNIKTKAFDLASPSISSYDRYQFAPRPASYINSPTSPKPRTPIKVSGALETSLLPLEAFLIKRRTHILKIPLEQSELWKQMQVVLARSREPAWDTLLALSADDHTDVCELLKSTEKDGQERILAAIEVLETRSRLERVVDRVFRRKDSLRRVVISLRVVPEYMRYTRPLGSSGPPPPPPPFVKVQGRVIKRGRGGQRSPTPPRIEEIRRRPIYIAAGAAAASIQRESGPRTSAANAAQLPEIGYGTEAKYRDEGWVRSGAKRERDALSVGPDDSASMLETSRESYTPNHHDAYVMGRPYDDEYVLEGLPRHHHPTRLDEVLEVEDEGSRPVSRGGSLRSGVEETRGLEIDTVDELLGKWTTVFGDDEGEDTVQGEKDWFDE